MDFFSKAKAFASRGLMGAGGLLRKFGAKGYKDYIQYSKEDPELAEKKKSAYIARHQVNEDWTDPLKAGTLSRYILWNKPTLRASIADFRKRFEK